MAGAIAAELRIVEWQNEPLVLSPYSQLGVGGRDLSYGNLDGDSRILPEHRKPGAAGAAAVSVAEDDAALAEQADLLHTLRAEYPLDEVIAPGQSEWEQMLLLREWVHMRFRHGWHHPEPPVNALTVLKAAAEGFDCNCGYYALTLRQCFEALGFVARAVSIGKADTEWSSADEGNTGHSVMEVWSHQWSKWVMLDADLNVRHPPSPPPPKPCP